MLIVQEQLRAVGLNMNLKIGDHTAYHADNRKDKNTLAMHSSSYPPIPTQLYFQQLSSASEVKADGSGGGNYSHYGVAMPGIDDLLGKALAATDFDTYVVNFLMPGYSASPFVKAVANHPDHPLLIGFAADKISDALDQKKGLKIIPLKRLFDLDVNTDSKEKADKDE